MQEHSAHQLEAATMDAKAGATGRIRQVWKQNLEQEMAVLRQLVIKYPYVSMVCFHQPCSRAWEPLQPTTFTRSRGPNIATQVTTAVFLLFIMFLY